MFIIPSATVAPLQVLPLGVAILSDRRPIPLIPRWLGFFCLLDVLLYVPAWLAGFFKHGALAWDGLLTFWFSVGAFSVWLACVVLTMLRAAAR